MIFAQNFPVSDFTFNMFSKFSLSLISATLFWSLGGFSQGHTIKAVIHNQKDSIAFLGHHFSNQKYVDDTARIINGIATFTGENKLTEGIYFYYSPTVYFELLIGEQNFTIEGTAPDVVATAKFIGSPINEGFYEMQKYTSKRRKEGKFLQNKIDSAATSEQKAELRMELARLNEEVKTLQIRLQEKYPGSLLDRLIRVMQTPVVPPVPDGVDSIWFKYSYYRDHFWDGISIADPGLLRSPMLSNKIMDYLDNVIIQQADSVIIAVDQLIQDSKSNDEAFRYLLITLTNKYESSPVMGFDKVFVHLVDQYYLTNQASWTDTETIKKLKERAASIRPNFIGNPAPAFTLQDTLGIDFSLYDIQADYTILYFYDPDCGHCKKATPILYEAYPELNAKGVEVLAICATTDSKRWHKFIVEYDLDWLNLADMESKTNIKYYYDVRTFPTVYILDKDKKILIKKIASEDIPQIIDQLIALDKAKNN